MSAFWFISALSITAAQAQVPPSVPAEPVANPGVNAPLQYVNPNIQQLNNNLMTTQPTPAYTPPPVSSVQPNPNLFPTQPAYSGPGSVPYYMAPPGVPYYPSQEAQQVQPGTRQAPQANPPR